ncbi:MAG: hypothetical protein V3U86_08030 [Acidobacteriota bacterium]
MVKLRILCAVIGLLGFVSAASYADDLTGAKRILCTSVQVTICDSSGDCEIGPPWNWNIPQFVEVDLNRKTLSTTKASGENRATPIRNVQHEDGLIFLQGVEAGRAFSFVIQEATGDVSIAVARNEITVSIFGACTPLQ